MPEKKSDESKKEHRETEKRHLRVTPGKKSAESGKEFSGTEKKFNAAKRESEFSKESAKPVPREYGAAEDEISADLSVTGLDRTGSDRIKSPATSSPAKSGSQSERVTAGSHDDNEEFAYYLNYLKRYPDLPNVNKLNTSERYILRVVDKNGLSVPFADLAIVTDKNETIWKGRTYPNGESLFFPKVVLPDREIVVDQQLSVQVAYQGQPYVLPFKKSKDNIIELSLTAERQIHAKPVVDIVFLLDTTGSMGDEIEGLKDVLFSIYTRIGKLNSQAELRFGMVLYRDRGDEYVTKKYLLDSNIDNFQKLLNDVKANGGGDAPEDMQAALALAVEDMNWNKDAVKLIFLLADAPPHTNYADEKNYVITMKESQKNGIKICSIGASGLDLTGEYIFRQISLYTYGQFIFLTYGEKGESDGAGDPGKVSHHTGSNYEVKRLDDLVTDIVSRELSYITAPGTIQSIASKPVDEKTHFEIRIDNLLQQIRSQLKDYSTDTPTGVLCPLECENDELKDVKEYIENLMTEKIIDEKWMKLVERSKLEKVLAEQELGLTGLIDSKSTSQIGQLLEAKLLLYGKLYYLGTDRVLHVRAVDVVTSEIVAAVRVRM